jgi:hypothetical protein
MDDHPVPALLYHYTDVQGFKGIVDSQELWATHIQYLNDTQEDLHAVDVAKRLLVTQAPLVTDPQEQAVLTRLGTELSVGRRVYVAVASFSKVADGLSQWRGYCPNGAGYSLGFVAEDLIRLGRRHGFRLARCLYDDASQTQAIAQVLAEVRRSVRWAEALAHRDPDEGYRAAVTAWLDAFTPLAPTIKHRAFHEEQEWRLISRPMPFEDGSWRVRPGLTMLIPYLPIKLTLDSPYLPIRDLVVGPTPHMELAVMAAYVLLEPMLEPVPLRDPMPRQPAQIRNSQVSYRQGT